MEGCYTDYVTPNGVNMTEKTVPEVQIKSVIELTKHLMNWNNIRKIFPHSQFNKTKDCPGKYFPFGRFLADCFKIEKELAWEQIADKVLDSKDRWILGYQKALELKGENKELEIFKFLPDLFVKLYYAKSE
jgi:N-acetyl-anhydromuramyl-L-alanine amidase AmpD